jgi:hypothetical protein
LAKKKLSSFRKMINMKLSFNINLKIALS